MPQEASDPNSSLILSSVLTYASPMENSNPMSPSETPLPDKMHVEFIRQELWRGRATVMVGSGFSANAEPNNASAPRFPLWNDLARELAVALYPDSPDSAGPDVMRLAEAYEHTAGRTALDRLLIDQIPDSQYEPGRIHQRLLELPWADIYTTNYDTLLERTRSKVPSRKYDLVVVPSDIARTRDPRIVKLHGSFPSHLPFIFTAEDYRTYPKRFAPFVNMVQQSVMETTFCLIGFSGNDPNFLQWAGWVRDQLGPSAPKIYLCGVLDLNPSKRSHYESLRVVPVDLGTLFPDTKYLRGARHALAMEWFLLSLHNGAPVDRSSWPTFEVPKVPAHSQELLSPPLGIPPTQNLVTKSPRPSLKGPFDVHWLHTLFERWREERKAYPGWVVCPEPNRREIASSVERYVFMGDNEQATLHKTIESLSPPERAWTLHEIVWRIRLALRPLPEWVVQLIKGLLEELNPRPHLIASTGKGVFNPDTQPRSDWDDLTEIWVELAFALINNAWQEQNETAYNFWVGRLERIATLKPAWYAR